MRALGMRSRLLLIAVPAVLALAGGAIAAQAASLPNATPARSNHPSPAESPKVNDSSGAGETADKGGKDEAGGPGDQAGHQDAGDQADHQFEGEE